MTQKAISQLRHHPGRARLREQVEEAVQKVALPRLENGLPTTWVDTWVTDDGISGCARWLTCREPVRWAHVNIQGAQSPETLAKALITSIEAMVGKP